MPPFSFSHIPRRLEQEPFLWSRASLAAPSGQLARLPPTPTTLMSAGAKRAEERIPFLALCQVFHSSVYFCFSYRQRLQGLLSQSTTIQALT